MMYMYCTYIVCVVYMYLNITELCGVCWFSRYMYESVSGKKWINKFPFKRWKSLLTMYYKQIDNLIFVNTGNDLH